MGGWGSRVLNFLVKIQRYVYMAYLTILSISFLSDPGKPVVRALGRDVTNKLQDVVQT